MAPGRTGTASAVAANLRMRCIRCGRALDPWQTASRCECGGLLEVSHGLASGGTGLKEIWSARRASLAPADRSGVWRFRELVCPLDAAEIVTRDEGGTGLYPVPKLAQWAGVSELMLKHEGENPTGSFKDRGMTVGVSVARKLGARMVACASTGNTSASLASFAALAGLPCVVFVPEGKTSTAKLAQALAYGAKTVQLSGDFDDAMQLLERVAPELGLYLLNSLNPWRLEGQKSVMFELLEAMAWQPPDWVILPGGNLGNTSAFSKALVELRELGMIDRLPRMAVVQAEGAAPFARAFASGWAEMEAVKADTIATAIRIGAPVNYAKARHGVETLRGVVTSVSDEAIMDAKALIDRAGVGCEPASAASVAGLRRLREEGVISTGDRVVAVLTGHLLKDPDATTAYHWSSARYANPPVQVEASEAAIRSALGAL